MLKKIGLFLLVVLIGLSVWLWIGITGIIAAENTVQERFRAIVTYYASLDTEYMSPLLSTPDIPEEHQQLLRSLQAQVQRLTAAKNVEQQYPIILILQKDLFGFFQTASAGDVWLTNAKFEDFSTSTTNRGKASTLIKSYNEALSAYNVRRASTSGKIAGLWRTWSFHQYMSTDGTLEDETVVSF